MHIYYNSQNKICKIPFGAVKTEEPIEFKIFIHSDIQPAHVTLRTWHNNSENLYPMSLISSNQGEYIFSVTYNAPAEPNLVWYYFVVKTENKTVYYANNAQAFGGEGEKYDYPPQNSYQMTVYDKTFTVPEWLCKGVMYQIFTDRFYNGNDDKSIHKKRDDYIIHNDWYEPLAWNNHPYENGNAANDFYGGNLKGIIKKLPYLKALGISILYLNPIFEAYSNHKYDTADYKNIDSMFGDNETFAELCAGAERAGIKIILDGVFSHTGADSIYFNKYKTYGDGIGAYQSEQSPYRSWYNFGEGNSYESWWGCTTLPNINEMEPSYTDYILRDSDAVIKKWLNLGASGWRLDVADELPDEFIKIMRKEVKTNFPEAIIIGEVWEDASNKISYGERREYLLGHELDSVMNYVFKDNLISFMLGNQSSSDLHKNLMKILENYPRPAAHALMNLVGGHDVARIKTVMGEIYDNPDISKQEKQGWGLDVYHETSAIKRVMLVALVQMTFVGVPCVYYGDEIGMQGLGDPLNRMPYTWRNADMELLEWYKKLIDIRNTNNVFQDGDYEPLNTQDGVFAFIRHTGKKRMLCIINRERSEQEICLDLTQFSGKFIKSTIDDTVIYENENKLFQFSLKALEGNIFEIL